MNKISVFINKDGRERHKTWGPHAPSGYDEVEHSGDLADSLKGTLFLKIAPAILVEKLNMPLKDAVMLIQAELAESLQQDINHVVPTKQHRENVKRILEMHGKKYGLSNEEVEKVTEILIELGEMLHEGVPNDPDMNARIANFFAGITDKTDISTFGKMLLENFPELKEAIEKHSDRITQLADELAELRKKREAIEEARRSGATVAVIEKKIPSEVEETFKTLKRLGVDLKLETGNVAERKAKIYAWLMQNGLITVEQEGEKVTVKPTEKMHQLLAKHGKAAGAILKWAAEEGVGLEHVEPVGKIISALEELRQIAKKQDPTLAKALEKAMKSKHTMKELYYLLQGEYTPEDLSER